MAEAKFDIVVVGAGIVGTSIAYHLACRGGVRVAVLEREVNPGMGSTAKAAGGIRVQFASEINVDLSRLSLPAFERFSQEMGVEVAFHQTGYLWLATNRSEMNLFEENVEMQRRHGLDVRIVAREEIARLAPYVRLDDLAGGTFHDKDGYAPPADFVLGYHKRAKELGVRFFFECEVKGFLGTTVLTNQGDFAASKIVCAAGAWSGRIGEMLGTPIPIVPVRRQCLVTEPIRDGFTHPIPMTIDYTTGIYMHSESGGLLIGKAKVDESPGFNEVVDYEFLEHTAELAMHRVPLLEQATVRTGWAGLYEVTPDHHPILGEIPERPGVYIAAGFSGHGVMHAPATGQLMAELLLDGRTSTLDISCLRFTRFQEGKLIRETHVI